jgi:hypothetical protein
MEIHVPAEVVMTTFHPPENFKQGDTWEIEGRLSYADGTPFNLSAGCTIGWIMEDTQGNTVLSLTLGSGITVLDPIMGRCLVTVQPSLTAVVNVGSYTDQLQAIDPNGYVSTQWQGTINARKSFFV